MAVCNHQAVQRTAVVPCAGTSAAASSRVSVSSTDLKLNYTSCNPLVLRSFEESLATCRLALPHQSAETPLTQKAAATAAALAHVAVPWKYCAGEHPCTRRTAAVQASTVAAFPQQRSLQVTAPIPVLQQAHIHCAAGYCSVCCYLQETLRCCPLQGDGLLLAAQLQLQGTIISSSMHRTAAAAAVPSGALTLHGGTIQLHPSGPVRRSCYYELLRSF
jgi:hypothetical protein